MYSLSLATLIVCILCCNIPYSQCLKVLGLNTTRATDHSVTRDAAYNFTSFKNHHVCVAIHKEQEKILKYQTIKEFTSEFTCARTCASQAYTVFGIKHFDEKDKRICWCADQFLEHEMEGFQSCDILKQTHSEPECISFVGYITSPIPRVVHIFRFSKNARAPGIFDMPSQFEHKFFNRFAVRRHAPIDDAKFTVNKKSKTPMSELRRRHAEELRRRFCLKGMDKQLKIMIMSNTRPTLWPDSHQINMLANWPPRSVLFYGQNEDLKLPFYSTLVKEFGVVNITHTYNKTTYHAGRLPDRVLPFFNQYWSEELKSTGRDWFRFVPLWLRQEFLDAKNPGPIIPSSKRELVYSYMVSLTSKARIVCKSVMNNETIFTKEQKYVHIAPQWKSNPLTGGYVKPDQYREYLINSVFTLAPAGHNPDQYRIYEAIVSGCIPVVSQDQMDTFPPSYKDSGMLVVSNDWTDAPQLMADAIKNKPALDVRQRKLMKWGDHLLNTSMIELEKELMKRDKEQESPLCIQTYKLTETNP
eukprot:m.72980 g.72980  ORF g.72980 m.72980 type:complete len:528 (+) comp12374_c0_seq1:227-1810(+)